MKKAVALLSLALVCLLCACRPSTDLPSQSQEQILDVQTNESVADQPVYRFSDCAGSYSPGNPLQSAKAQTDDFDGGYAVYIPDWNRYYEIHVNAISHRVCVDVLHDYAWAFRSLDKDQNKQTDAVHFTKINRESGIGTQLTFVLPEQINQSGMLCEIVNESDAYVYLFAHRESNMISALTYILSTTDGGETWSVMQSDSFPAFTDQPFFVKHLSPFALLLTCSYKYAERLEDRTYLSFDNGTTWTSFVALPYPDFDFDFGSTIVKVTSNHQGHFLTVYVTSSAQQFYLQFYSADLASWYLLPDMEEVKEDQTLHYSFIDQNTGYIFRCGADGMSMTLQEFLKTEDGGKTWLAQTVEKAPSLHWREWVICAKMLSEDVGFISGGHRADDNLSRRTYITTDGGKNWEQVVLPKDGPYVISSDSSENSTYMASIEAYDLLYKNGTYILYLRHATPDSDEMPIQYASTDLKNWTAIE